MNQTQAYGSNKKVLILLFVVLAVWWSYLYFGLQLQNEHANLVWAAMYQLTAFWGAISGIIISRSWGGSKSLIGMALIMFSVGLLLQNFGQTIFSIYNLYLQVEIPYPSYADIGFFGSIPFYTYGTYLVGKVCGAKLSLRSNHSRIISIVLPIGLLIVSYFVFLKGYSFDLSQPIKTVLDFGYPLGQALYISFALLCLLYAKNFLGGVMRNSLLLLLTALIVQYVADFNFLMQVGNLTWVNGGYGDFLYLISYTVMSLALIQFGSVFAKIRNTQ